MRLMEALRSESGAAAYLDEVVQRIVEHNPYHDHKGQFSSADGAHMYVSKGGNREWTATDAMPSCRSARITRDATAPRLATRTLWNAAIFRNSWATRAAGAGRCRS